MKFADTTAPAQREAIAFEVDLRHPPEKVWRALTEPELLAEWLLPVIGFRLEPGAAFTLKAPQAYPGWDGTVSCRMLEIEPRRKLSYTWAVPFLDTVVTFELTPTGSGTRLFIVQSGFRPDQKQEFGGARYGWKMMSGRLGELLERIP
jgi:uncharacterized protein YndB with AHSA1/START domain